MMSKKTLTQKRQNIDQVKQNNHLPSLHEQQLEQSIVSSWQRSTCAEIPKDRCAAPLVSLQKEGSPSALAYALEHCAQDLKHIAQQSSMVLAIGDIGSTIIWTAASAQMQRAAENVHFIAAWAMARGISRHQCFGVGFKNPAIQLCVFQ